MGSDTDMGPGGLATPNRAGVCGRPPTTRPLLTVREDGGCIVLVLGVGRCAFRPPRVVFVLGLVSLINSLTSGKKGALCTKIIFGHRVGSPIIILNREGWGKVAGHGNPNERMSALQSPPLTVGEVVQYARLKIPSSGQLRQYVK